MEVTFSEGGRYKFACYRLTYEESKSPDRIAKIKADLASKGKDGYSIAITYDVFGTENKYLLALRDVLKEAVNDQYDYIDWWLYEAADDFEVWEADCTMKYCLKEPEALYDFITGTLKPVPVSSGESTSQQE